MQGGLLAPLLESWDVVARNIDSIMVTVLINLHNHK